AVKAARLVSERIAQNGRSPCVRHSGTRPLGEKDAAHPRRRRESGNHLWGNAATSVGERGKLRIAAQRSDGSEPRPSCVALCCTWTACFAHGSGGARSGPARHCGEALVRIGGGYGALAGHGAQKAAVARRPLRVPGSSGGRELEKDFLSGRGAPLRRKFFSKPPRPYRHSGHG